MYNSANIPYLIEICLTRGASTPFGLHRGPPVNAVTEHMLALPCMFFFLLVLLYFKTFSFQFFLVYFLFYSSFATSHRTSIWHAWIYMEAEYTDASDLNVAGMLQCTPRSGGCTYRQENKHRRRGSRENKISFFKPHKQHMAHINLLTVTYSA